MCAPLSPKCTTLYPVAHKRRKRRREANGGGGGGSVVE